MLRKAPGSGLLHRHHDCDRQSCNEFRVLPVIISTLVPIYYTRISINPADFSISSSFSPNSFLFTNYSARATAHSSARSSLSLWRSVSPLCTSCWLSQPHLFAHLFGLRHLTISFHLTPNAIPAGYLRNQICHAPFLLAATATQCPTKHCLPHVRVHNTSIVCCPFHMIDVPQLYSTFKCMCSISEFAGAW